MTNMGPDQGESMRCRRGEFSDNYLGPTLLMIFKFSFGWTNGVILDLLDKYGDIVDVSKGSRIGMISTLLLIVLAFIVTLLPVRFSYDA